MLFICKVDTVRGVRGVGSGDVGDGSADGQVAQVRQVRSPRHARRAHYGRHVRLHLAARTSRHTLLSMALRRAPQHSGPLLHRPRSDSTSRTLFLS